MNNVAGFDRRGWRTGFTCYRFAIPDFAGRSGKAIYNDVDQIYLADPALLFDLALDGHGYLAIDARDTSVMLIDCEKMLPWWNRAAASAPGAKGPLTKQAGRDTGPVGRARPHWNARDLEYARGAHQVPALHGAAPAALEPVPRSLLLPPEPAGLYLARPRARCRRGRLRGVHPRRAEPGIPARSGSEPASQRRPYAGRYPVAPAGRCSRRRACKRLSSPAWAAAEAGLPDADRERSSGTTSARRRPAARRTVRRRVGRRHLRADPGR